MHFMVKKRNIILHTVPSIQRDNVTFNSKYFLFSFFTFHLIKTSGGRLVPRLHIFIFSCRAGKCTGFTSIYISSPILVYFLRACSSVSERRGTPFSQLGFNPRVMSEVCQKQLRGKYCRTKLILPEKIQILRVMLNIFLPVVCGLFFVLFCFF